MSFEGSKTWFWYTQTVCAQQVILPLWALLSSSVKGDGRTESRSIVTVRGNKSRRDNGDDLAVVVCHCGCQPRGAFSAISCEGSENNRDPWELFQSSRSKYHLQEIISLSVIKLSSQLICTHRPQMMSKMEQLLGSHMSTGRDGCISYIIKGLLCWIRMCLFWAARVQPEILWFWKLGEFLLGLSSGRKLLSVIRQVPCKEMTRGVCKHWEDRASGAGRGDRCDQGQICWNGCILSGTLWWSN